MVDDSDEFPTEKIVTEIKNHDVKDAIVQIIIEVSASKYRDISDKIIRESLSEANFVAAIRKNVAVESKNRLGRELHESVPPMEALKTYLNERNLSEEKLHKLLEKGQNLMSEIPPQ